MQPTKSTDSKTAILDMLLPKDYPHSVHSSYRSFSFWNFAHNVTGSISGVLSLQCLLHAVGLGSGSIPMAAALNWIVKDGLGQFGGVLYASIVNDKFDSDPKRHRFRSACAMQIAGLIEILTPWVPHLFLPLASLSNVAKNIAWLASSASKAQIHRHIGLKDNIGDVTAKSGSQATLAGLIGTGLGVLSSSVTGHSVDTTMTVYLPLSVLCVYSNYRSCRSVVTPTLNIQRFELLLEHYFNNGHILSPQEVAAKEVFVVPFRSTFEIPLDLEPPFDRYVDKGNVDRIVEQLNTNMFAVIYAEDNIALLFHRDCTDRSILRGFYDACILRRLENSKSDLSFEAFISSLSLKGWSTEQIFIGSKRQRIYFE